jgi:hypothetical protein
MTRNVCFLSNTIYPLEQMDGRGVRFLSCWSQGRCKVHHGKKAFRSMDTSWEANANSSLYFTANLAKCHNKAAAPVSLVTEATFAPTQIILTHVEHRALELTSLHITEEDVKYHNRNQTVT